MLITGFLLMRTNPSYAASIVPSRDTCRLGALRVDRPARAIGNSKGERA
jgi:hypothetical protein